ncbi:MAG: GntR family transcriptional regulator [Rhodobacteraceae bacterium]|nr:GntR family transcriptional regulator [Paracoccaceae bacterium]
MPDFDQTSDAKVSAARRVEQSLVDSISAGEVKPGARMDEVSLAEKYGVSRTPVREALNRLAAQGILVPGEKRGLFVAEYSREELGQIFEAMHEIEIACARIASQRLNLLTRSEIEMAQAACMKAAEDGDRAAYLRANEAFHQTIYRATGNPYIAEIAREFRHRTGPFRAKRFATAEDLMVSAKSHDVLISDIFSENSTTATTGMRNHMTESLLQTLKAN